MSLTIERGIKEVCFEKLACVLLMACLLLESIPCNKKIASLMLLLAEN